MNELLFLVVDLMEGVWTQDLGWFPWIIWLKNVN